MSIRNEIPPRPYIPPSACGAVSCLATAVCALEYGWASFADISEPAPMLPVVLGVPCVAVIVLMVIGSHCNRPDRGRVLVAVAAWTALGIIVGLASSLAFIGRMERERAAIDGCPKGSIAFRVTGDPASGARGYASTCDAMDDEESRLCTVRLSTTEPYESGSRLRLVGRFKDLSADDWGRSRYMRGEVASVDAVKVLAVQEAAGVDAIGGFRRRLLEAIDPAASPARALIAGVVCGRTTELAQTDASDAFSCTGLSHLVAVSGSHLALIATLLQVVLIRIGMGGVSRSALLGCVMAVYVVFTGGAPSAVRSLLMVVAVMACSIGGRRGHQVSALSIAVLVLIAGSPGIVYDLGFQLSAASVLFIALFGHYLAFLLERLCIPRAVAEALSMTLAAQWATLPLTIPVFEQLSVISPLANLIVGPLMSALLVAGILLVPLCAYAGALQGLMGVAAGLANLSIWCAEAMSRIPYASIAISASPIWMLVVPYAAAAFVYLIWRDWAPRTLYLASLVFALALGGWFVRWRLFAPAEVVILDVGQADAILIRERSSAILVDAGVDDAVVEALARHNVFHLDAVVVTHWDRDHWGGLPDILEALPVSSVMCAAGANEAAPDEVTSAWRGDMETVALGDTLRAGGFSCRVVWPVAPVEGTENGESLCLDVSYASDGAALSVLLTGDTELDQERAYAADVGDVDVLKVGHHGSKVSLDRALLDVLDPEVAIASAGEGNSYGHPTEECVDAVQGYGARFLCTKDVGDVTVRPGAGSFAIELG